MLVELVLDILEFKLIFEDAGFVVLVNELLDTLQKDVELVADHAEFILPGQRYTHGQIAALRRLNGPAQHVDGTEAVSYTHLDVYKRPVMAWSCGAAALLLGSLAGAGSGLFKRPAPGEPSPAEGAERS